MSAILIHPFELQVFHPPSPSKGIKLFGGAGYPSMKRERKQHAHMDGWFSEIIRGAGDFIYDMVAGLAESIKKALESTIKAVGHILETIRLILGALVGQVSWYKVFETLGKAFQEIGNVLVQLNPLRLTNEVLNKNPVFGHAFRELDKFTGGMLTTAANVSDLVFRAMRGDPISEQEFLADALFIIQIVSIWFGGPLVLGAFVGGMVGREACKHADDVKEACQIIVTIAGAAAGGYLADAYSFNWLSTAKESGTEAGKGSIVSTGGKSFTDYVTPAANKVLGNKITERATQTAIAICQNQSWAGKKECAILGQVAADYIAAPEDKQWPEFLAEEVAKIGAAELINQWLPPGSPEQKAVEWHIKYVDLPPVENVVVTKTNYGPLIAIAGAGVALFAFG